MKDSAETEAPRLNENFVHSKTASRTHDNEITFNNRDRSVPGYDRGGGNHERRVIDPLVTDPPD